MSTATDQRLTRIENMLRKVLRPDFKQLPLTMKEEQVMAFYHISRSRLKQLRLGHKANGVMQPPVLFKWTHINGRKIEYNVKELEAVFKRKVRFES